MKFDATPHERATGWDSNDVADQLIFTTDRDGATIIEAGIGRNANPKKLGNIDAPRS